MCKFFFFVLYLCLFLNYVLCDSRATEVALICSSETASMSARQTFISNFLTAMDRVTPLVGNQGYAAVVNGTGANTTVYAFGECMKDLSRTDCDLCFASCKTQILKCFPYQKGTIGGRLFYDGCYLRYDDHYFFYETLSPQDKTVCGNTSFSGDHTNFRANAMELVRNLSMEAPKNDGFFVGMVNRRNVNVYGLAQCWEFVKGSACESCLNNSVTQIDSCGAKEEGRVLNAGCYLRYSTHKFYYNSTGPRVRENGGRRHLAIILAVIFALFAVLLTLASVAFFMRKKILKQRRDKRELGSFYETLNKSKLNFSYDVLEKATNYFNDSNKLGQGGSGTVYKGILPDGKVVAIKRLFFNTRQWVDLFFNEVNLISGIHHKNLVELLGCSITGPESLLVYEYVSNQSLHDYFFRDPAKKNIRLLSWDLRYKIILGTAEGLSYLHEESNLRIIHRDIKLSNILLDQDFTSKIADFGLARLFSEDETHISTAIAGTIGYMAPEYVTRGKLTEKADVYSFGVLVIEVVCGRPNNFNSQSLISVLEMVWGLYGTGRLADAVDPVLEGNFRVEEASRLLQIGLLCVQASAELRPSMSIVVKMLAENHEVGQPTQPPFLQSSIAEMRPRILSGSSDSLLGSHAHSSWNDTTESWIVQR